MIERIQQAIGVLFQPGQLVEIRGKLRKGGIKSSRFTFHDKMARVLDKSDKAGEFEALWYTLQRLKQSEPVSGETTKRDEIEAYEWLVIDIDRPKDDPHKKLWNSTDEDLQRLKDMADKVARWLASCDFPEPILACSGNGWHLLYKLPSLPATQYWYDTLKDVLKVTAIQFAGHKDVCDIDTSLAEPEQVIKAYGTMSRKSPEGSSNGNGSRPWRESYIERVPRKVEPVTEGTLEVYAAKCPAEKPKKQHSGGVAEEFRADPYKFFDWAKPYINIVGEYEKDGKRVFVSDNCCLRNEEGLHTHSGSDRKTEYFLGDSFGVQCFGGGCDDKGIGDVLRKLTALKGGPWPGKIWDEEPDDGVFDIEEADEERPELPKPGEGVKELAAPDEVEIYAAKNSEGERVALSVVMASSVKAERLEWLWPDRIPKGKVTLFGGKPGTGKSMAAIDLAARTTTGRNWPDGTKNGMGSKSVLLAASEDDLADTLIPRLMAAGADMRRVMTFPQVTMPKAKKRALRLKEHALVLKKALAKNPDIALVVLDPITGYFGGANPNRDEEIRPVMESVADACEKSGATFIGIIHNNKRSDAGAIEKILGASSVVGVSRAVWAFSRDQDNKDEHFMSLVKGNLSRKRGGMKYGIADETIKLGDGTDTTVGRIEWLGEHDDDADEILAKERDTSGVRGGSKALEEARHFLRSNLDGHPRLAKEMYTKAEEEGISVATLRRAKYSLKVICSDRPPYVWSLLKDDSDTAPLGLNEVI